VPSPAEGSRRLPLPIFPQHPDLLALRELRMSEPHFPPLRRRWTRPLVARALRGWLIPYLRSRILPGDFHPIIAYLFTEWKCNLDCHYCWAFDNRVQGMSEDTAVRTIDWLHSEGCRVLALMGGEVLLRRQFVHKVVYYAAKKGFWIYVPTNGRLLNPDIIDRLGDAGAASFNLAVDAVNEKTGLPKALMPIWDNFLYLAKRQYDYGYTVFFNMNICRNNLDDIRELTEIAHVNAIATDYHINESPMMQQDHFQHATDNETFLRPEDFPKVDALLDDLIAKNRSGYKMVNSSRRLQDMKAFMRGGIQDWQCRAGRNSLIIRVDGSLAPCFPLYSSSYDWGHAGKHNFEARQLARLTKRCQPHCFSTLNHNLAYCYDAGKAARWVLRQALHGFQGVTGSFE
jgi:MoaA/NifB/PqqE/SkfB family radical SAM enzyme